MTLQELKAQVRKHLAKDDLKKALNQLLETVNSDSNYHNDIILQHSRYNSLKRDESLGILSFDNAQRTANQIKYAVLSMVDDLEEEDLQ